MQSCSPRYLMQSCKLINLIVKNFFGRIHLLFSETYQKMDYPCHLFLVAVADNATQHLSYYSAPNNRLCLEFA